MIDERLITYMNSLDSKNSEVLCQIEAEALRAQVPIIRQETQNFLKFLVASKEPKRILEIGCAVGFSAILLCEWAPADCRITTIEKYEKRIPVAKENFRWAKREEQITLLEGDAMDILAELEGSFDLIFMDAAKGQYIRFLPLLMPLLTEQGILVSDNVLQDGDLIESKFAVERRNRTIHKRMREYLYTLTHHEELVTTILPVGDGLTVSVKKSRDCSKERK